MFQLTYISTSTRIVESRDVDIILASSRQNNAIAGVTGLLLYDGKRFLQALEGDAAAVRETYARIKVDARHRAIVLLSSKEVDDRMFGEWSMAAQRVTGGQAADLPALVEQLTQSVPDANIRELFRSFAQVRSAA